MREKEKHREAFSEKRTTLDAGEHKTVTAGEESDPRARHDGGAQSWSTRDPRTRSVVKPLLNIREAPKELAQFLRMGRMPGPTHLSETIPGSTLNKLYAIQFDTQILEKSPPDWRPRFVIVWKAKQVESVAFDPLQINGHAVRSPSKDNAIYSLQPDYSLRLLPLTAEKTTQLLSHITAMEKRKDERVAYLLKLIERQEPQWYDKVSAYYKEEQFFPPDRLWAQEVDPHLKVVEPEPSRDEEHRSSQ